MEWHKATTPPSSAPDVRPARGALAAPPPEGQTLAAGDPNPWTERYAAPLLRPFTQLQGSPLQHSLQLLPGAARHGPGQAGALLQDHLLPGHLLGHELAGEARRAEHHQVVRPLLGHHDERTASRSPGRAESTAPASHAATPVPRAATASSVAAAGTPRSRASRARPRKGHAHARARACAWGAREGIAPRRSWQQFLVSGGTPQRENCFPSVTAKECSRSQGRWRANGSWGPGIWGPPSWLSLPCGSLGKQLPELSCL